MKTKITPVILAFFFVMLSPEGIAQKQKAVVSFETDPTVFVLNGYAFHVRIKPKRSEHFLLGIGTYALDMPKIMVDMTGNKGKGWNVRINSAYSAFGEYYFSQVNRKWFVGLQSGVQNYKNTNSSFPGQIKYSNMVIMPSIGYSWQPFRWPVYIKPWFGLGYTTKISGDNRISNLEYKIAPFTPFMTFHLGYSIR